MRKSTILNLSVVMMFLCGLLLVSATKANAHFISGANGNITCTGDYRIQFDLIQLSNVQYTIFYELDPSCASPTSGQVIFTPPPGTAGEISETVFATGKLTLPPGMTTLPSNCTVTGSAFLKSIEGETGTPHGTIPAPITITTPPQGVCECIIPGVTISDTSWNKFNIPAGTSPVVWVHAHIGKPSGIPTNTTSTVLFTGVSINISGTDYPLPDGMLTFVPGATSTTTTFNAALNRWETTINPANMSDEIFFTGAAIPVTPAIAAGGKATLSFTVDSSAPKLSFPWQWSAAVYTFWPADWNQAMIQPFHNSLHAGTPLNTTVQKSLIQGPRGGGGSNFTGSWSATGKGTCP